VKNTTGTRTVSAFKLKPTIAFAGQATAGAFWALAASGSVYAQAAPAAAPAASAAVGTPEAQQVEVVGIRRGIEAAINVKKNADGIVEAISAEDIGKLPDTTIAESLARLPGLTAQRDRTGNATNISIRGLGPDFNGYLLNGREQTSTGDSRAVDLSVYPAELIASATVYKTSDAAVAAAGLAGTIDQRLIDPLSMPGRVLSIQGVKTSTGRGKGLPTPGRGTRYSLAYIDQFADRKVGIALGFVHADGKSSSQGAGNWGDSTHNVTLTDGTQTTASIPGFSDGISLQTSHVKDNRNGLAGVLEFRPNANFTSEIDFYHAKIKTSTKNAAVKVLTGGVDITDATLDADGHVSSGTFTFSGNPAGIIDYAENIYDDDTLQSFGWKNSLKLSDTWRVSADLSHNSAKRFERDIELYAGIAGSYSLSYTTPNGYGVPQLSVDNPSAYTTPGSLVIRDQTGWSNTTPPSSQLGYIKGPTTVDKIDAVRLDFTHDLQNSLFADVQFGANVTRRTKDRTALEALIESSTGGGFDTVVYPSSAYVEHNVGGSGFDMLTVDPTAALYPGLTTLTKFNDDILSKTWNIREEVSTLYGKLDIDTELGSVPLHGNVGLQYVHTDQSSGGYRAAIGSGAVLGDPGLTQTRAGATYGDVLPSLNLAANLGSGNILRFAAGVQIARGDMTQLRNAFAIADDTNNHVAVGSAGNPTLKPFKAKALDLSYEKYFAGNKGYFSGALFYKKLDNYIVQKTIIDYDFTDLASAVGFNSAYDITKGIYTTTVNGHGGNLKGLELALSVPFSLATPWLEGFGATASYSNTTSSIKMPNTIGSNPSQQVASGSIPMVGLSHINNKLMLYYERGGFSAFVAQNSRSVYIGSVANSQVGGYPTLVYVQPQKWVSAQVGYEVDSGWLKGLGVRLEGNNLNHPVYREANYAGSITTTNKTGASVDLRVSYKL